jgi:hypothetical protein
VRASPPAGAPEAQSGVRASPPAGAPEARAPRHCHLTGAGFLGKPLRAIFRFRHQDAQTPLLPLWEKGGRGDEGQQGGNAAHRALLLRTLPLRRHCHLASTRASPPAGAPEARAPGHCHLTGAGFFGEAPARHLPFQASRRPNAPFSPCVAVLTKVEPDRQVEHSWE